MGAGPNRLGWKIVGDKEKALVVKKLKGRGRKGGDCGEEGDQTRNGSQI
jgi:hypothetical protein